MADVWLFTQSLGSQMSPVSKCPFHVLPWSFDKSHCLYVAALCLWSPQSYFWHSITWVLKDWRYILTPSLILSLFQVFSFLGANGLSCISQRELASIALGCSYGTFRFLGLLPIFTAITFLPLLVNNSRRSRVWFGAVGLFFPQV